MAATALPEMPAAGQAEGGDMLALWAEATGRRRTADRGLGGLRFAFLDAATTRADWITCRAEAVHQRPSLASCYPVPCCGTPLPVILVSDLDWQFCHP